SRGWPLREFFTSTFIDLFTRHRSEYWRRGRAGRLGLAGDCEADGRITVQIFTRTGSLIFEKSRSNVAIFGIACSLHVATISASLGRRAWVRAISVIAERFDESGTITSPENTSFRFRMNSSANPYPSSRMCSLSF